MVHIGVLIRNNEEGTTLPEENYNFLLKDREFMQRPTKISDRELVSHDSLHRVGQ
jgi:hypothetical protein